MQVTPRQSDVLVGTSRAGDFVHETQPMAILEGHRNVSKSWYERTRSLESVIEEIQQGNRSAETILVRLSDLEPIISDDGKLRLLKRDDGRLMAPDGNAMRQFLQLYGIPTSFGKRLAASQREGDAGLLIDIIEHQRAFFSASSQVCLRVRDQDRLTGVLSAASDRIRNDWYLGILQKKLPGARVSHWNGEEDTLLGNLLIPDTIRQESDSEYGAMISISNCEVLSRSFHQRPSLFRAICMNGCIWGQERGRAITRAKFGRGSIDLDKAERAITENIDYQIPLITGSIDKLLSTRQFVTDVSMKLVITRLALDEQLNKAKSTAVLNAWNIERKETPDYGSTLFGLINGVTRAAHSLASDSWVQLDELGGRLAQYEPDDWRMLVGRASRLRPKEIDERFAAWDHRFEDVA